MTVRAPWPACAAGVQVLASRLQLVAAEPVPVPAAALALAPALALVPGLAVPEPLPAVAALGLTGVEVPLAPPVPALHCCVPCLSQAGGSGSVSARVFVPFVEKVGLWQSCICVVVLVAT